MGIVDKYSLSLSTFLHDRFLIIFSKIISNIDNHSHSNWGSFVLISDWVNSVQISWVLEISMGFLKETDFTVVIQKKTLQNSIFTKPLRRH